MGKVFTKEIKEEAVRRAATGETQAEIASGLGITERTIRRWKQEGYGVSEEDAAFNDKLNVLSALSKKSLCNEKDMWDMCSAILGLCRKRPSRKRKGTVLTIAERQKRYKDRKKAEGFRKKVMWVKDE